MGTCKFLSTGESVSLGECELCGTVYVFLCVSCDCVCVPVCIMCACMWCSCEWPKGKQRDGEMEAQKEKRPTEPWACVNTERVRE